MRAEESHASAADKAAPETPRNAGVIARRETLFLRIQTTYSFSRNEKNDQGDHSKFLLSVQPTDSVAHVKRLVLERLQLEPTRYIRLICQGRLLAPDAALLESFSVIVGRYKSTVQEEEEEEEELAADEEPLGTVVHAVVAAPHQVGGVQAVLQQQQQQQQQSSQWNGSLTLSQGLLRRAGIGADGTVLLRVQVGGSDSTEESTDDDDDDEDVSFDVDEEDESTDLGQTNMPRNDSLVDVELGLQQPRRNTTLTTHAGASTGTNRRRRRRQSGNAHLSQQPHEGASTSAHRRRRQHARIGFDRLREAPTNLSHSQVQVLRGYFSSHMDQWLQQLSPEQVQQAMADAARSLPSHVDRSRQQQDPLYRRRLQEEAWMQVQGPLSEFWLNLGASAGRTGNTLGWQNSLMGSLAIAAAAAQTRSNSRGNPDAQTPDPWPLSSNATTNTNHGSERDFTWGFFMGFFVGFIMLVWVWMPSVPHKQKMGILTGITVQMALSMLSKSDPSDINSTGTEYVDDVVSLLKDN